MTSLLRLPLSAICVTLCLSAHIFRKRHVQILHAIALPVLQKRRGLRSLKVDHLEAVCHLQAIDIACLKTSFSDSQGLLPHLNCVAALPCET